MGYTVTALKDVLITAITETSTPEPMLRHLSPENQRNMIYYGSVDFSLKAGESREDVTLVASVQEASGSNRLDNPPHPKDYGGQEQGGELILIQKVRH